MQNPTLQITHPDGKTYTLVLNVNAVCALEDATQKTLAEVFQDVERGRISAVRDLIWAAMKTHQPTITIEDVGAWIDTYGGFEKLSATLAELVASPETPRPARRGRKAA